MNLLAPWSANPCGQIDETAAQEPVELFDLAPDFELLTDQRKTFRLSDNFGLYGKTTVLIFSRAHWCPYCLKQLIELRRNANKFEEANAQIVVVFRDDSKGIDGLRMIKSRSKVDFVLALDNEKIETPNYSPGKMEFSSYVINACGVVQGFVKGDKTNRAKSQRLLDIIHSSQTKSTTAKARDRLLEESEPIRLEACLA